MYTLSAFSTNLSNVVAGNAIPFNTIASQQGKACCGSGNNFTAGSTTVQLQSGVYKVHVNANVLGTVAGLFTLQLTNNNVNVGGAVASATTAEGSTANIGFDTIIVVPRSCKCVSNNANLQVLVPTTSVSATLSNVNITVQKIC